jgi:calcium-activated chloride channel regulator 3/4
MNSVGFQSMRRAAFWLALSLILTTLVPFELLAADSWLSKARSPQGPAEPLSARRKSVSSQTVFDATISLYNNPSGDDNPNVDTGAEQQTVYERIIRFWADGVCEESNGAHKLGKVRIFRKGSFPAADVIWNAREHPRASPSGFGVSGEHLIFGDVFPDGQGTGNDLTMLNDPEASGYTLAHEWGHYVYGLYDEYRGQDDGAGKPIYFPRSSDTPPEPSIMNNQWRAAASRGGDLRWLNHSTSNNYQAETGQGRAYGASGWEVLVRDPNDDPRRGARSTLPNRKQYSTLSAVQPTAADQWVRIELPNASCRSELEIQWMDEEDLELELVIDRSGSMDGAPLDNAKAAAQTLVDVIPLGRTALGVVSFDDTVQQDVAITPIVNATNQNSVKQTIGAITTGGATAIFDAASQALANLQAYRNAHHTNANRVVFLLTDGQDNSSSVTQSDVTNAYLAADVPLITFGYGDFAPDGVLRELADDTGGLFYASPTTFSEIQNAFLAAISSVSSTLTLSSFQASAPASSTSTLNSFQVDGTLESLTLLANYDGPSGTVLFSAVGPHGVVPGTVFFCQSAAGTTSCVAQVNAASVAAAGTGTWTLQATNSSGVPVAASGSIIANPAAGRTYDVVAASTSGSTVAYPEPIVITAAVNQGARITGVNVVAAVTRPSGTTQTIPMHDDGRDGDGAAGDGIYSLILGYDSDGTYGISVSVDNAAGAASFARQGYAASADVNGHEPPPAPLVPVTEKFQRQARIQITVTGVEDAGGDDHPGSPLGTPLPHDNTEISGRIDFPGDLDHFFISGIPSGQSLAVRVTEMALGMTPTLSLYRLDGTLIRSANLSSSATQNGYLVLILQPGEIASGSVVARVEDARPGASGGTYRISAGPALISDQGGASKVLAIDDQPGDGRWQVTVHYGAQAAGLSGDGHPVPLSSLGVNLGGLFWFFSAENPEMLIKVINACSFNQKFWVFYAAGTNVGLTVTVRDSRTGQTRTYTNPDGRAAPPIQDTSAFSCTVADIALAAQSTPFDPAAAMTPHLHAVTDKLHDARVDFPLTPVGSSSTASCAGLCYQNPTGHCDRSGTLTLDHSLSPPFAITNLRLHTAALNDCSGTPVAGFPVDLAAGQSLLFDFVFSPTQAGSFSDSLVVSSFGYDLTGSATGGGGGACVNDAHTLCIAQRFKVQVSFDSGAQSGLANSVQLSSLGVNRGGLFWFFSQENPEMLIKVLDACSFNQKFWVFYAAGTDVGLTVTVTDTMNGHTKTYTNPRHTAAPPVQDTVALPCN